MSTGKSTTAPSAPLNTPIDWRRVVSAACLKYDWTTLAKAALGSTELAAMVGDAFRVIGRSIEDNIARADAADRVASATAQAATADGCVEEPPSVAARAEETAFPTVDKAAVSAATLLGVSVDASADEVRAALRARLSASRLHPDQGGDGEEAKRLIGAKNLLVERLRATSA